MLWSRSPQSEKMRAEKQSNAGAGSRFRHLKRLRLPNNGGQVKACCCDSECFRVSGLKSNGTEFALDSRICTSYSERKCYALRLDDAGGVGISLFSSDFDSVTAN